MNKNKVKELLPIIIFVLGALATVLLSMKSFELAPALGSKKIPGFGLAFGSKDDNLKFNFLNVVALLLPILGGLVAFLKRDKLGYIISTVGLALAVTFVFLVKVSHTALGTLTVALTPIGIVALVALIVSLVGSLVALLFDLDII